MVFFFFFFSFFFFFFSFSFQFCEARWTGANDPKEDLAKFGYRGHREKVEKFSNPTLYTKLKDKL
jgi:hypothetical protein